MGMKSVGSAAMVWAAFGPKICFAPENEGGAQAAVQEEPQSQEGEGTSGEVGAGEEGTSAQAAGSATGEEGAGAGGEEGKAQQKGSTPPPRWALKRIDELTRARKEEAQRAEALAEELRLLKAAKAGEGTVEGANGKPFTPEQLTVREVETLAEQRAQQLAKERAFNEACNNVYSEGVEKFKDFKGALAGYQSLGGLNPQFIEAALDTGKASEVLYHLGKDLDEASRIMGLSPTKQAVELARLADRLGANSKKVTAAPPPVKGVVGGAPKLPSVNPEDMSMDEFVKWRQENAKKGRR